MLESLTRDTYPEMLLGAARDLLRDEELREREAARRTSRRAARRAARRAWLAGLVGQPRRGQADAGA